jgi:hypothetical protein
MDDNNIRSNESTAAEQQLSIDPKANPKEISYAQKSRKVKKIMNDLAPTPTTFWILYVYFFQYQT